MTLDAFLDLARRTAFVWGRFDCSLWAADWLVACGHRDPAADLRGTYADQAGAERVLAAHGGLTALWERLASLARLEPVHEPRRGDVGVVLGVTPQGFVEPGGAICAGRRWALFGETGVIVASCMPVAAWRV